MYCEINICVTFWFTVLPFGAFNMAKKYARVIKPGKSKVKYVSPKPMAMERFA